MNAADEAAMTASLFAVDPIGLGGVCLRSQVHPAREQWLHLLRELLPAAEVMRRIPSNISDSRLLGGLDLVATLKANRAMAERGVLGESDGGVVIISMAERLTAHSAACLNAVLDTGEVAIAREGVVLRHDARVGVVALDEGIDEDEFVPYSLLDRLAFLLDLHVFSTRAVIAPLHDLQDIIAARSVLPGVLAGSDIIEALCAAALALGAGSPRISLLALRAARALAALAGRRQVLQEDAALAARLVLAPRATTVPQSQSDDAPASPEASAEPGVEAPQEASDSGVSHDDSTEAHATQVESNVLAAAQAAIPKGLLSRIASGSERRAGWARGAGRAGAMRNAGSRGRPIGIRAGPPQANARLNLTETLRAAALWQQLRGRGLRADARVRVEPSDFRVTRCKQRARTLIIFAVDASGSAALNRLAEAKGAVELLLADCYIRRDQVAVIAFRGRSADLLLPPTRSLTRAKRALAGLPGGGGTPLAAALSAGLVLATQTLRRGETPTLVMLSDGRANVAHNGVPGREAARRDALTAAQALRRSKIASLFIDTSPRPDGLANELALAMNARYVALPYVNAQALSGAVKEAMR